jgi:hypothetical protein
MKGFKTTEEECNRNNRIEENRKQFMVEFNRYYFTKRYEKVFDFCINNIADEEIRHVVYTKAMLAIEKLTNRIELSDKSRINKDWMIDALVNYGHKNMKLNGDDIIVWSSKISVTSNNQVKIEGHPLNSSISLFFISIFMLFSCFFIGGGLFCLCYYFLGYKESSAMLTCSIVILMMYKIISMQFKSRKLIRRLATSILNHYNNL